MMILIMLTSLAMLTFEIQITDLVASQKTTNLKLNRSDSNISEFKFSKNLQKNVLEVDSYNSASNAINKKPYLDIQQIEKLTLENNQITNSSPQFRRKSQNRKVQRHLEEVPDVFDWRDVSGVTSIKNQGVCSAGWAHAIVAFFQQDSIINQGANISLNLSQKYLLDCDITSKNCEYGFLNTAMDLVLTNGLIPIEQQFLFKPYQYLKYICLVSQNWYKIQEQTYRMSFYNLADQEKTKKLILDKPIVTTVCSQDFLSYDPINGSRMLECDPVHRAIDHAVLLIGYTETEWIVKNSQGVNVGLDGYIYISREQKYDCCIGEQMYTTGKKSDICSVKNCELCVEENTCNKCINNLWVYQQPITNIQTCARCKIQNCQICQDFKGTCYECERGYAIDKQTKACIDQTIHNCRVQSNNMCAECIDGYITILYYKLWKRISECVKVCQIDKCKSCLNSECDQCYTGNSLVKDKNGIISCQPNSCEAQNCKRCNQNGECIKCDKYFALSTEIEADSEFNSLTNPNPNDDSNKPVTCVSLCKMKNCSLCNPQDNKCLKCKKGLSFAKYKKKCEQFFVKNCNTHDSDYEICQECNEGYTLTTNMTMCFKTCSSEYCVDCYENFQVCKECIPGRSVRIKKLSGKDTYTCEINQCNVKNCIECDELEKCIRCEDLYLLTNQANQTTFCMPKCKRANCEICDQNMLQNSCPKCAQGYILEQLSGECLFANYTVEHCSQMVLSGETEEQGFLCLQCQSPYQLFSDKVKGEQCLLSCKGEYCKKCDPMDNYICRECIDGYSIVAKSDYSSSFCTRIQPVLPHCQLVNEEQDNCYKCKQFYKFNHETKNCEPRTEGCIEGCKMCEINQDTSEVTHCICEQQSSKWNFQNKKCQKSSLNDSRCISFSTYQNYQQETISNCILCVQGYQVSYDYVSCEPQCAAENCEVCFSGENMICQKCLNGYVKGNSDTCMPVNITNCIRYKDQKCIVCEYGYLLFLNKNVCQKIQCQNGQQFNGFDGCECPYGQYKDSGTCLKCQWDNCEKCDDDSCNQCFDGFFLEASSAHDPCNPCLSNCIKCYSASNCSECEQGYFFDISSLTCKIIGAGAFITLKQGSLAYCAPGCITCASNDTSQCSDCDQGFSLSSNGECVKCQGSCKKCYVSVPQKCRSCNKGFALQNKECVKCSEENCAECPYSAEVCIKCAAGFGLSGQRCFECASDCLKWGSKGSCISCKEGFTLVKGECLPCIQNCGQCNSQALQECLACRSNAFMKDGVCNQCPKTCLTCSSVALCTTCSSGYELKNGSCYVPCATGCKTCEFNSSICFECFAGYTLSGSQICEADVSCSTNLTCQVCPIGFALQSFQCIQCSVSDSNCVHCKDSDVTLCSSCVSGYYLRFQTCVKCPEKCKTCIQESLCLMCADGFFLQKIDGVSTRKCQKCKQDCKTCSSLADMCTSCAQSQTLTSSGSCVSQIQIETNLTLEMDVSKYTEKFKQIRSFFISFLPSQYSGKLQYFIVKSAKSGSTVMHTYLAIPKDQNAQEVSKRISQSLSDSSKIAGQTYSSSSTSIINLSKDSLKEQKRIQNQLNDDQNFSMTGILVGGVSGGILIIIFVIVGIFYYKKKSTKIQPHFQQQSKNNQKPNEKICQNSSSINQESSEVVTNSFQGFQT